MSKYHSKKVIVDGITFDSKKESKRYITLKELENLGCIQHLKMQVKFVLIPEQREESMETYAKGINKGLPKPGKLLERECVYIADFVYWDCEKEKMVVEDTKGFRTPEYIIKRKLMLKVHGIQIKEI